MVLVMGFVVKIHSNIIGDKT